MVRGSPDCLLNQHNPNFLLTSFDALMSEGCLQDTIERSINDCYENIFHRLASKSLLPAFEFLTCNVDSGLASRMILTKSANKKSPLILAVSSNDKEVASLYWMKCEEGLNENPELIELLRVS